MFVFQLKELEQSKMPLITLLPFTGIFGENSKPLSWELNLRFVNPVLKAKYEAQRKELFTCVVNITKLRGQLKTNPKNADLLLKVVSWEKKQAQVIERIGEITKEIEKSTGYHGSHSFESAKKSFIKRYVDAGGGLSKNRQGWKSSWLPFLFDPSADEVVWPMGKKTDGLIFAEKIVNGYLKGTIYEGFIAKYQPVYFQFSGRAAFKFNITGIHYRKSGAVGLVCDNGLHIEIKTAVHELIHYLFEGFSRGNVDRIALNEGYTEFFAQRICRKNGNEVAPSYDPAVESVFYLEQIAGKDVMECAYAGGNTKELEQILDSKLGKGFFKNLMAFDSKEEGCEEFKSYVLKAIEAAMKKGTIKGVKEYKPEYLVEE